MPELPTLLVPGRLQLGDAETDPAESGGETPVAYICRWIRARLPEFGYRGASLSDRVLIVRAETGSGKSTVMPVEVFRLFRAKTTPGRQRFRGAGVVCTQPRVLTAIALAADVAAAHSAWNPDMVVGETVGFQTGPVRNRPPAGLIYATAGVLAAQLRTLSDAEVMEKYRVIIVDEAHERSLDSDMLLVLLKWFFLRNAGNERLPFLLLASATIVPRRYADYFGVSVSGNVVSVRGRAYPIERAWPDHGANDYALESAAAVERIHLANLGDPPAQADVLVFVPGEKEAKAVALALEQRAGKWAADVPPVLVLTINREVVVSQSGDYALVFAPPAALPPVSRPGVEGAPQRPLRRVIVATVVAETGLTIDTLKYVVDCGWNRARVVYQPWDVGGLVTLPAAQSRVLQRMGRAGRLFPGEFHPTYTKNTFGALDANQLPEIVLSGPAAIFIHLVREQQRQKLLTGRAPDFLVSDLDLLDPPPPEAFLTAHAAAVCLGFVSLSTLLPDRWPFPKLSVPVVGDAGQSTATPRVLALSAGGPASASPIRGQLRPTPPTSGGTAGGHGAADEGPGLTELGRVASLFQRTSMEAIRVLLAGCVWGAAAADLITAAAMFGEFSFYSWRAGDKDAPGFKALHEAAPKFLRSALGAAGGNATAAGRSLTEADLTYLRLKTLVADDFAEAVFVFDRFALQLEMGSVSAAAEWCEAHDLTFRAMVDLARRRNEVIEEMVTAGLDPFRGEDARLSVLPPARFADGLRRFKRCVYDGLRHRLLHRAGDSYQTPQGTRAQLSPLHQAAGMKCFGMLRALLSASPALEPRWLVCDTVGLGREKPRAHEKSAPLLYGVTVGMVCSLDGYVDVDPGFTAPPVPSGPAVSPASLDPQAALEAYERVTRAARQSEYPEPPRLTDEQLSTLYGAGYAQLIVR